MDTQFKCPRFWMLSLYNIVKVSQILCHLVYGIGLLENAIYFFTIHLRTSPRGLIQSLNIMNYEKCFDVTLFNINYALLIILNIL